MESMFFLAGYFSIVPCGPLYMRVWWPFQKNRTCIPFFGSGYAGLGLWRFNLIEDLWRDLIYAGRGLRRSPALVLSALLSLGLGIGANTAIFQLINAVKLRSLPVQRPNELAEVRIAGGHGGMGMNQGQYPELTRPVWQEIRTQQQAFSGVFAWTADGANVGPASDLHRVKAIWVTGDFFHARCPTLARTADSVGG